MDAAVVVIEVAAPKPLGEHLSALVAACNRASERAACVLAEHAPDVSPNAVAIVKSDGDHVRVEVGLRRSGQNEWHTRELDFEPNDDAFERWRTVGFAIGTLAQASEEAAEQAESAQTETPVPPPPRAQPAPRAPETPPPVARAPVRSRGAWFDGAFGAGPALDEGRWRAEGTVRTGLELSPDGLFFGASTFYSQSLADPTDDLELTWLGLTAGGGYPLIASRTGVRLEARIEASFAHLSVTAISDQGRSDRGDRWLFGGRAGLNGVVPLTRWLGVFAAADGTACPPTDIRVGGQRVASVPALTYAVGGGFRIRVR